MNTQVVLSDILQICFELVGISSASWDSFTKIPLRIPKKCFSKKSIPAQKPLDVLKVVMVVRDTHTHTEENPKQTSK